MFSFIQNVQNMQSEEGESTFYLGLGMVGGMLNEECFCILLGCTFCSMALT